MIQSDSYITMLITVLWNWHGGDINYISSWYRPLWAAFMYCINTTIQNFSFPRSEISLDHLFGHCISNICNNIVYKHLSKNIGSDRWCYIEFACFPSPADLSLESLYLAPFKLVQKTCTAFRFRQGRPYHCLGQKMPSNTLYNVPTSLFLNRPF